MTNSIFTPKIKFLLVTLCLIFQTSAVEAKRKGCQKGGDCQNGYGDFYYTDGVRNGDRYAGGFRNGDRHGEGTYYWWGAKKGQTMSAMWANDRPVKAVKVSYPDGSKYSGGWDMYSGRRGEGKYTLPDGSYWHAEWFNDEMTRFAVRYDSWGKVLVESYIHPTNSDTSHKFVSKDLKPLNQPVSLNGSEPTILDIVDDKNSNPAPSSPERKSRSDELASKDPPTRAVAAGKEFIELGEDQFYFGGTRGGEPHGEGEMTWRDGRKYDGEWARGKRNGSGTFTYALDSTADKYEGSWIDDERYGYGVLTMKSGKVFDGSWIADDFKGNSKPIDNDGKSPSSRSEPQNYLTKQGISVTDAKQALRKVENAKMVHTAKLLRYEIQLLEGQSPTMSKRELKRLEKLVEGEVGQRDLLTKKQKKSMDKWMNKTDRALCMEWMTAPSLNIHQNSRQREIKRRGIDCWEYGDVDEEGRKSTQRFMDALNNIGRRGTSRASSSPKRNSNSGSRDPNAPYLTDTNSVIGGVMCSYSDGSVINLKNESYCPRRMGDSF